MDRWHDEDGLMHWARPQLVRTYLQHRSSSPMADYLLHLVGRKLTSGSHADDSAGNVVLIQINIPERHWSSDLTRAIKELNCIIRPKR